MVKKIRFPLEMENEVEVRSMEELRDNFSISKVLGYLKNGKLITWLRDRNESEMAELIEKLDLQDKELAKKVCKILEVPYDENMVEVLKRDAESAERIQKLKEFVSDEEYKEYKSVIEDIAFDQEELHAFLNEGKDKIYLCGEKFSIPLSKEGVAYIGINQPVVVVESKEKVDWVEKKILIENVVFDQKYQEVLNNADETKGKNSMRRVLIGDYSDQTYLNFMIPIEERGQVKQMYQLVKKEIEKLNYDLDDDIRELKTLAVKNGVINLAERYIEQL